MQTSCNVVPLQRIIPASSARKSRRSSSTPPLTATLGGVIPSSGSSTEYNYIKDIFTCAGVRIIHSTLLIKKKLLNERGYTNTTCFIFALTRSLGQSVTRDETLKKSIDVRLH